MENELKVSVTIKASKAVVWDGLTNPEQIKKYFFGTETRSEWKVGSTLTFSGEWEGKPYEDKGIILAMEPERLLKYNYWSNFSGTEDIPENYANITYLLEAQGDETVLTVMQDGFKDEAARKHSEENWGMVLKNLKELLEK